jgi:hypothetical protein
LAADFLHRRNDLNRYDNHPVTDARRDGLMDLLKLVSENGTEPLKTSLFKISTFKIDSHLPVKNILVSERNNFTRMSHKNWPALELQKIGRISAKNPQKD